MGEDRCSQPQFDRTQSPPKLAHNILRTEFIFAHGKRSRRLDTRVDAVIAEDELGPFLRLSDQVLEGTGMTGGSPVRLHPEFEIITVNLRKAKE